jgi:hypothetical protein
VNISRSQWLSIWPPLKRRPLSDFGLGTNVDALLSASLKTSICVCGTSSTAATMLNIAGGPLDTGLGRHRMREKRINVCIGIVVTAVKIILRVAVFPVWRAEIGGQFSKGAVTGVVISHWSAVVTHKLTLSQGNRIKGCVTPYIATHRPTV